MSKTISSVFYKALASDVNIKCSATSGNVKIALPPDGETLTISKIDSGSNTITIYSKDVELEDSIAQVETATVAGTVTQSGNATVVFTSAEIDKELTISVEVLEDDTATIVALKIANVLNRNEIIADKFSISASGETIVITQKECIGNDITLNLSIDNDTCTGLTTAASSANTTAGVAVTISSQYEYKTLAFNGKWSVNMSGGSAKTEILTNKTLTTPTINQPALRLAPATLPLNAVAGSAELPAALTALLEADDKVDGDGFEFTMVAADPTAIQFTDVAGLTALINGLANLNAVNDAGKVTITAATKGVVGNDIVIAERIIVSTTSGGSEVAKAACVINAAVLAQLYNGSGVVFDGVNYEKAATTDVPTHKFADTAGLISCIDATTDWAAAASGSDIAVTAAVNGAAFNDKVVTAVYPKLTASGQNGTVGVAGDIKFDANNIYICTATNTIADANWKATALS